MVRDSLEILHDVGQRRDRYGTHSAERQVHAVRPIGAGDAAPEACCDDVTALVATYPECALGPDLVRALADHIELCETCARSVGGRAEAAWAGSMPAPAA